MKDKILIHNGGIAGAFNPTKELDEHCEIIKKGCNALADYLEIHYPGLKEMRYASDSLCSINGDDFINRMSIGIYIELAKAGLFKKDEE